MVEGWTANSTPPGQSGNHEGHYFICDGYNSLNQYHIKWDMGNSEGYYPLYEFGDYNAWNWIIVGFEPESLVTDFSVDLTSGDAPLTVNFSDLSTGSPVSWQWDFENDGVVDATVKNPEWTYSLPGIYSVKLVVSNGITTDLLIKSDYITVDEETSHALLFDGTDDFVKAGGVPFPTGDMTIEAWIHPTSLTGVQEIVFFYDDVSGVQFRAQDNGSILYGESVSGDWGYVVSPANSFLTNEWTHVAVTKQGDNCNLYINGVHSGYYQFDKNPTADTLNIGARSKYMDRFFDGNIDEVRIWAVARSQSEIQANMTNYLDGTETGLYVYYKMNEGAGETVYDLSGNGFDGRLGSTNVVDVNNPIWLETEWPYEVVFTLDLKVYFEGPFNGTDMDIDLITGGFIPTNQPYDISPWNYGGTETADPIPLNVVDWVLVDFMDAADAASAGAVFEQQVAFLLNDGSIVGLDGSSNPRFTNSITHQLFISVWHRNHVSVLSANPANSAGSVYSYDFSTAAGQAYGADAQKDLGNNMFGMIGGDANADGAVDVSDKVFWSGQAGTTGYKSGDFDLNGQVDNLDKNDIWVGNYE